MSMAKEQASDITRRTEIVDAARSGEAVSPVLGAGFRPRQPDVRDEGRHGGSDHERRCQQSASA